MRSNKCSESLPFFVPPSEKSREAAANNSSPPVCQPPNLVVKSSSWRPKFAERGRSRNDVVSRCGSGSHGEAHVTEMRFLIPGCQEFRGSAGEKMAAARNTSSRREPARALLVAAHEAGSGLSAVRDILNDPGFRRWFPLPHQTSTEQLETEKWRREGRSRYVWRHDLLEEKVGVAGDDSTYSPSQSTPTQRARCQSFVHGSVTTFSYEIE